MTANGERIHQLITEIIDKIHAEPEEPPFRDICNSLFMWLFWIYLEIHSITDDCDHCRLIAKKIKEEHRETFGAPKNEYARAKADSILDEMIDLDAAQFCSPCRDKIQELYHDCFWAIDAACKHSPTQEEQEQEEATEPEATEPVQDQSS